MSRKRMFAYIVAGLLALFVICSWLTFFIARQYVSDAFSGQEQTAQSALLGNEKTDWSNEPISLIDGSMTDFYAYTAAVFDADGKALARSGSQIQMTAEGGKFIYLDDYISEAMAKKIAGINNNKNKTIRVRKATYCIRNGQYVPVKVTFFPTGYKKADSDTSKDLTLRLTDYKATATIYPELDMSTVVYQYTGNNKRETLHNLTYAKISYKFNDDKEIQKVTSKCFRENATIGQSSGMGRWETSSFAQFVTCNGQKCIVYYYSAVDTWKETLYSNWFQGGMWYLSIIFIIFLIIALVVANMLYNKNKALVESKRAFTGAVAHEMKTPLAIIQNQCECLLENAAPEKHDQYINSILEESQRMNGFVMTFLQFNRLSSAGKIKKTECNVTEIVKDELKKYEMLFSSRGLQVKCDITEGVSARGTAELLALAIGNYLSNAARYADAGGQVKVTLTPKRFIVYNDCDGIPDDEQRRIWDVLYREDANRSRSGNSTGMGLSICRRIFELLGYGYGCRNIENGAEFYFEFS